MDVQNVLFIIAVKYNRNYISYVKYYVDNIQKFYPNGFCILVDNNSKYISELYNSLNQYKNLVMLINESPCKFEIGAYNYGITYALEHNILHNYEYIVCIQDTFVLKNKYDFNNLKLNNILACVINDNSLVSHGKCEYYWCIETQNVIEKLNCNTDDDTKLITPAIVEFCWCSSFILHKSKIDEYLNITSDIIITGRTESCKSERYLGAIMYKLNDYKNSSIEDSASCISLGYNCWTVNIINDNLTNYFVKSVQQKTERTPED